MIEFAFELFDPFRSWVVRRVRAARNIIEKEVLVRIDHIHLVEI